MKTFTPIGDSDDWIKKAEGYNDDKLFSSSKEKEPEKPRQTPVSNKLLKILSHLIKGN